MTLTEYILHNDEECHIMRPKNLRQEIAVAVMGMGLVAAGPAFAQTVGDAAKGKEYASSVCASCHNIGPGGVTSRLPPATPFQIVADTDGMTATALTVFFRTPHKNMPNLIIEGENADNVIAYILSLKKD